MKKYTFASSERKTIIGKYFLLLLILSLVALFFYWFAVYIANEGRDNPKEITYYDLQNYDLVDSEEWVEVKGIEEAADANIVETSHGIDSSNYLLLFVSKDYEFIFVKIPTGMYDEPYRSKYIGKLSSLSYIEKEQMIKLLIDNGLTREQIDELMIPVVLDIGNENEGDYISAILIFYCTIAVVILVLFLVFRQLFFVQTVLYKNLKPYKESGKYLDLIQRDYELNRIKKFSKLTIYPSGVVIAMTGRFDIIPVDQWIWIYTSTHRINGRRSTYNLIISTKEKSHVVRLQEKDVDTVMVTLANYAPWAIMGYSDEVARRFKVEKTIVVNEVAIKRTRYQP